LAPLFVASGFALHATAKHDLDRRERDSLLIKAAAVAGSVGFEDGSILVQAPARTSSGFARAKHPDYFFVLDKTGRVLTSSPSAKDLDWHPPLDTLVDGGAAHVELPNGRPGMATIITLMAGTDLEEEAHEDPRIGEQIESGLRVVVADDIGAIQEEMEALDRCIASIFGGVLAIACVVVAVILRRRLAPLDHMAVQAQDIDVDNLDRRFETGALPSELEPIRDRLNDLLARLEESFARESRFNTAVAHELRTPIAELRTLAEVAQRWPDAQEHERVVRDVLAIAERMQSLVSTLLLLRRVETERGPTERQPVKVSVLLAEVLQRRDAVAQQRSLHVEKHVTENLVVSTQPEMLELIADNWIANAFEYAPAGSRVDIAARVEGNDFVFETVNDAPRIATEDLPHLFEPFWRKDDSRSGDLHSGLGLPLTKGLATALGCKVHVSLEGQRLHVLLRGPA
jgi:signal transduction histidine kinase